MWLQNISSYINVGKKPLNTGKSATFFLVIILKCTKKTHRKISNEKLKLLTERCILYMIFIFLDIHVYFISLPICLFKTREFALYTVSSEIIYSLLFNIYPSILLSFYHFILLYFYPSILLSFYPSILLSFFPSILLSLYPYTLILILLFLIFQSISNLFLMYLLLSLLCNFPFS